MKLLVKTLKGEKFNVECEPTQTVLEVKGIIVSNDVIVIGFFLCVVGIDVALVLVIEIPVYSSDVLIGLRHLQRLHKSIEGTIGGIAF